MSYLVADCGLSLIEFVRLYKYIDNLLFIVSYRQNYLIVANCQIL
uniref:Uncharacterized protein n=1 Tax=Arundo donax TaxID=35708 RepID=A0A0A9DUS1_ARUDO